MFKSSVLDIYLVFYLDPCIKPKTYNVFMSGIPIPPKLYLKFEWTKDTEQLRHNMYSKTTILRCGPVGFWYFFGWFGSDRELGTKHTENDGGSKFPVSQKKNLPVPIM